MNKKIIFAVLIIVIIVVAGYFAYSGMGNKNVSGLEIACKNSGGVVSSAMCCGSASDFPNLCLIGACGCSPENSHEVKICDCGQDKCFDGASCK